MDVVRLHAAAVDDVALVRGRAAEPLPDARADVRVRLAGLFGRGVASGADRPHRLVGDDQRRDLIAGQPVEPGLDLPIEHGQRLLALALLERFADADDRRELRRRAPRSACGSRVSSVSWNSRRRSEWPMITYSAPASRSIAALTSPVNAPSRSQCRFCPATPTLSMPGRFGDRVQRRERRRDDDLDVGDVLDQAAELFDEHHRLVHGLEHLPVGGDERGSHRVIQSVHVSAEGSATARPAHVRRCAVAVFQRRDPRQVPPAEEFERRAAAGRDVRDPIGHAGLRHRRNRIAAADDGRSP